MHNPSGTGQPDQRSGAPTGGILGTGGAALGGGGAGRPPGGGFPVLGGGQGQPPSAGANEGQHAQATGPSLAPGQEGARPQPNPSQLTPAGAPPSDGASGPQRPSMPSPAPGGTGRDLGQIDSSSGMPPAGPPRAAANGALSKEEIDRSLMAQSRCQLGVRLHRWLSSRDEVRLHEHGRAIAEALGDVNLGYRLNRDDLSFSDLQQSLASPSKNFQWGDWMMRNTRRDNQPFGSGAIGGGQLPSGESEEERRKLSPLWRKELLVPLCEEFNLEPEVALKLLESYFCEQPKHYRFLYSLAQGLGQKAADLAGHRQKLAQLASAHPMDAQQQVLQATITSETRGHDKLLTAFRDQAQTIKRELLQFYMQERGHVLESLTTIFAHSSPLAPRKTMRPMVSLRAELLGPRRLVARLIENLKRNLRWEAHEFKGLDEQQRPVVLSYLQREQIMMLELLFSIAQEQNLREGHVDIELSHLVSLYEYLASNDFSGQLICVSDQPAHIRYQHGGLDSLTDAQRIAENKIKDLGVITYLAMLRIDVFQAARSSPEAAGRSPEIERLSNAWNGQGAPPKQQDLRDLSQNVAGTRLDPRNSIVCLALLQVFRRIEQLTEARQDSLLQPPPDFVRELLGQPFVSELDNIIRQSPLLSVPGRSSSRLDDDSSTHTAINGEFLKVLTSFINLIYEPILEKGRKEDDIQVVRAVALDVLLKNPQLLRDVWRQVDASRARGRGQGQQGPKDIMDASTSFSAMKMFEGALKTPLASLPFYSYLLRVMCGKNRNKHAEYVFRMLDLQFVKALRAPGGNDESELLTVQELAQNVPHTRLLHEMLVALTLLLSDFSQIAPQANQMDLDPARTDELMNLIVIFSKIIKQSPQLCADLAGALAAIVAGRDAQNAGFRQVRYQTEELFHDLDLNFAIRELLCDAPDQYEPEQGPESPLLLNLLMSCLFVLMRLQMPAITGDVIKHVMDAVSSMFSSLPGLKKRVIDAIDDNQRKYQLHLTSYFFRNWQEHERAECDLKCTVSYLKFVTEVFKTDFPQMLLSRQRQLHISHSILDEMLRVFYRKMVKEFFRLEFRSIGSFAKFAKRVLKLTYTLLGKFDSGDSPVMRIECKQPCPRFDPLLNVIAESLSDVNLGLIMQPLELEEMTGFAQSHNNIRQSFLQNKFHAKLISRQTITSSSGRHFERDLAAAHGPRPSGGTNIAHEKILVNDMISQSLKCLNQMMRLCVQVETTNLHLLDKEGKPKSENFLDTRGVKLHYAQKLTFVKDLRQQLMEPSGARGHLAGDSLSTKHNLVSLMAFYSKAECELQAPAPGAGGDHQHGPQMLISSTSEIKVETNVLATSCLKMYCQLWRTQPNQRVDFKQYLLRNGFLLPEDLKNIFLVPLVAALRHLSSLQRLPQGGASPEQRAMVRILRRYLTQMFELLALCAHSQKPFLLLLLQQRPGTSSSPTQTPVQQLVNVLSQFFDSLGTSLEQKDDASRQMARALCQRIVSFLSVVAQEKTATDFVKDVFELAASGRGGAGGPPRNLLRRITDVLILPVCVADGMTKATRLDLKLENHLEFESRPGEELDLYQQERQSLAASCECDRIHAKVHDHCTSVLTIVEFLQLVQRLFALDPLQNAPLRAVIEELFTDKRFGHFLLTPSIVELKRDASQTCEELSNFNRAFMQAATDGRSQQLYDSKFRREQWEIIERENLLLNDQRCSPLTHALVSKPGQPGAYGSAPVYLSEIDAYHTISALTFLHKQILGTTAHSHFSQWSALAASFSGVFSPSGGLGANFCLSTTDIKYTLLANGYLDLNAINHLTTLAAQYNLCMSALWCQLQLVQAKDSFMMAVGRVKLSLNLRSLPSAGGGGADKKNGFVRNGGGNSKSFQILASMFPLVDKDFPRDPQPRLSQHEMINSTNRLVKENLTTMKEVFEQLKQDLQHRNVEENGRAETTYLSAKHSEATFEYLETVLSSLNLCVSPSALMNVCPVERLDDTRELVDFLCKDFLVHLPQVFHDHLSRLSASGGSFGAGGNRDALVGADHAPFRAGDSSHSSLFMQLVLSSFQILESITKDEQFDHRNQRAQGIQACLPQVVRLMSARPAVVGSLDSADGRGSLFQTCVRALQVSIDLLSEKSVQEFMDRGSREQPLGIVIKRLIDAKNCNVEETIMIVQFLNTYAQSRNGALHLVTENIFQHLLSSPCITQAQTHDFYLASNIGGGQRDPFSMLWLQVLLLVRSLNEQLLDEEVHLGDPRHQQRVDPQSYMRSVVGFLQQQRIDFRVSRLLCPPEQGQGAFITQAQLEATELTVCIVCQLFMQAELLGKTSYGLLQGLKDCLIFGTTRLLSRFAYGLNADVRVASPTERYLKNQTAFSILQQHKRSDPTRQQLPASAFASQEMGQGFSLFDLKAQMQAVKIFMTSSGALLNLLLQDKELSGEFSGASAASPYRQGSSVNALFPTHWHYLHAMLGSTHHSNSVFEDFNKSYICSDLAASLRAHAEARGQGALLQSSLELTQQALTALQHVYKQWTASIHDSRILFATLKHVFQTDDVSREYFGLNALFMSSSGSGASDERGGASDFDEFIEMFETALEMGNQLMALLLEKLYQCSKGQVRSAAFGSQVGVSQRGVMECASQFRNNLASLASDLELGERQGQSLLPEAGRPSQKDAGPDSRSRQELFQQCDVLQAWATGIVSHAQASHSSNRTSCGVAAAGPYTPEKYTIYETDRFGLGNPQGFDRGGERSASAAPGSALPPGGTLPASAEPGGGKMTGDYSAPLKKT